MTPLEIELINIIRNSSDPEKTIEFMLNLILDFLKEENKNENI